LKFLKSVHQVLCHWIGAPGSDLSRLDGMPPEGTIAAESEFRIASFLVKKIALKRPPKIPFFFTLPTP